jgi:2-dehydro-3-deoxygalactonokinase
LIAIDWGTTSARAYRLDRAGAVIETRHAPLGIQAVRERAFAAALDGLLGPWRDEAAPRIACGMIGSRQGWIEVPYLACPAELAALGGMLSRTPGGEVAIVPGARCVDAAGVPDVMRGEETQLAGAVSPADERVVAVLPGTHSKWALVERGHLVEFATFMTGELYAILLEHSILGRMAERGASSAEAAGPAFAAGVARGLAGGGLAHVVFGARTLALAGELPETDVGDWLSGALIGCEVRAARTWAQQRGADASRVRVIGGDALVARYAVALEQAGVEAEAGAAHAAARGLFRIARRAGLVS